MDVAIFAASVMEGVAFSLRDCLEAYPTDQVPLDLRIIGGGAKSDLWCQILSDVLRRPIKKVSNNAAAYGAALMAKFGAGKKPPALDLVNEVVSVSTTFLPDDKSSALYDGVFSVFQDVRHRLTPIYEHLRGEPKGFETSNKERQDDTCNCHVDQQ